MCQSEWKFQVRHISLVSEGQNKDVGVLRLDLGTARLNDGCTKVVHNGLR